MVPVIALVGRPNVGKSTLFNRLTKSRDALVAEIAGLTRDRKYGEGKVGERPFIVIDTGGISGEEVGIDEAMASQSFQAIQEADIVFFMVDASAGILEGDRMIANYLRKSGKSAYLIANKIDGKNPDVVLVEMYELGMGEPLGIAAAHNRGVSSLIDHVMDELHGVSDEPVTHPENDWHYVWDEGEESPAEEVVHEELDVKGIKIAVVGRPNVGKSTLVNRFLGEDRVVVYDEAGTTRDSIYIPYERHGQDYTLIDTAGVRRRKNISEAAEKFSIIKTLQAIQDCHVCILVLDARTGIVEQDLHMLSFVLNAGRALVIAINKWDGMEADEKQRVKDEIDRRFDFLTFADMHFISALHGTGVGHLYESVDQAYESAMGKWQTNMLTRILEDAVATHQPPMVRNRRPKLRYAHQGGSNPPVLVIHGNLVNDLPDDYKRYLANTFRRVLAIKGTPIRVEFRQGENPFADKQKEVRHRRKSRAEAVVKTANIRQIKLDKYRKARNKP
ncbi:ribosome biogenesis GTPase Der [Oceanobacter sp. 5_MG-2023]|uniref:ribosome biogenesis GTPase Der n=1 Tax=Oceanobacter sp. 5_MG-2023 TaxID=3062645 RepID=UPI0026E2EA6F|nr:ribosome biogenesis GTPase Der [Oceanobacter sp. 5_MG-2023]MDO6682553.1 ribosome biogenesis GTPase Der [Oceanobacter sp. 5_MG-2023]